jgi:hypothetical protein
MERALLCSGSDSQGIELCGRCETLRAFLESQLSLLEHVHELDPGQSPLSGVEHCRRRLPTSLVRTMGHATRYVSHVRRYAKAPFGLSASCSRRLSTASMPKLRPAA